MGATFDDLSIPFPLFAAPASEASEYVGVTGCDLCGRRGVHCFTRLSEFIVPCPACGTVQVLGIDSRADGTCRACAALVPYPQHMRSWGPRRTVFACYGCLRAGRAAFTRDSEFGMVRWEDAVAGLTHGGPFDPTAFPLIGYETVPSEDGWVRVRLPSEHLLELTRTPAYSSWQGEGWLIHHRRPMIYLGAWDRARFDRHAPDSDGRGLFARLQPKQEHLWPSLGSPDIGVYVFRCAECGELASHLDFS